MKTALKVSILLDLFMLGVVIRVLHHGGQPTPKSIPPSPEVAPAAPMQVPAANPKLFHWSQLESSDYRTYVANLRAVGCPEQTIRDIITADVDSLYAARRKALEEKQASPAKAAWPSASGSRQALDAQLEQLHSEETYVLAALLGPQSSLVQTAEEATTPPARALRHEASESAVSMPLVFQNLDPATLKLSDHQIEVLGSLRQEFQQEVGGPDQDPQDPAYRRRWQAAQRNSDDLLQGMLGGQFYLDYQIQAARQSPQPQ
jgi:hypothetical protein